jgi:hypothetical protein
MPRKAKTEAVALIEAPEPESDGKLSGYALVELFGHSRIVGAVSEKALGSTVLVRIDVPDLLKDGKIVRKGFTRMFGPGAIYAITPVSEEIVRQLLPNIDGTPIEARALTASSYNRDRDGDY